MTYKDGYEQFRVDYHTECLSREVKEHRFTQKEVIGLLSRAYIYIGNTYELVDSTGMLKLAAGQDKYVLTGSLLKDFGRSYLVTLNDTDKTALEKTGINDMPGIHKGVGLPSKYTVIGQNDVMYMVINSLPGLSWSDSAVYSLLINYKQELVRYMPNNKGSFSDITFTGTDWGGKFLTPWEWDDMIIRGAVGFALGVKGKDVLEEFYVMCKEKAKSKDKGYHRRKPKYHLGV